MPGAAPPSPTTSLLSRRVPVAIMGHDVGGQRLLTSTTTATVPVSVSGFVSVPVSVSGFVSVCV